MIKDKLSKIKRNHVIISALVVMVAVAGYLTYIDRPLPYDPLDHEVLTLNPGGEITALIFDDTIGAQIPVVNITGTGGWIDGGAAIPVDGPAAPMQQDPGTAVFVNSSQDSSFFLQSKLTREQSRSMQVQLLTDLVNNPLVAPEQRADSAAKLMDIKNRMELEAAVESLIESKGFREVYARVGDETIDIVVNRSNLTSQEVAQIEDIARRKTGFSVSQIQISPLVVGAQ